MHDIALKPPVAAVHEESRTPYYFVWVVLLVLTGVEVVLTYNQVFAPLRMLEVLMGLSVVKSALIIAWFMHLKFEIARMKWVLMVALVVCLTLMFVFFADAFRILSLGVK
ncbi:MAG TPA: cytochrome C oxidase subunit IV family protein [Terriglobales bacterium]|nr:cytochrome C oxidase subunit IV family protein [Terriglobales bacterium]